MATEAVDVAATTVLNVNMANITKLSQSNYLMWSLQVLRRLIFINIT